MEQQNNEVSPLLEVLLHTAPVCQRALRSYGLQSQIGMAHEEMGELAAALNQYQRGRVGCERVEEELADVLLMTMQLAHLGGDGGPARVASLLQGKAKRLDERLASKDVPSPGVSAFDFWR